MTDPIQKIQYYPIANTNENDYAASGWFKFENHATNQTSGPNEASIRIAKSVIPLEGILSYDNTLNPSEAFKGVVGTDGDEIKYVTFSTETGVDGQDGENINLNIEMSNLNDGSGDYGEFYHTNVREDIQIESLTGIENNNPNIEVPYKFFNNKNYFDLSYKQIIFEPNLDISDSSHFKYRVMVRNGLVNNSEIGGIFDTFFDSNKDFILNSIKFPNFYSKKITSINYDQRGIFNINSGQTQNIVPNSDIGLNAASTSEFFEKKNISPYFYNFETELSNTNTKIYQSENYLIMQFKNLKKKNQLNNYNFSYEFRLRLDTNKKVIFEDDYKPGTIIFSYSKMEPNIANPIIGIFNGNISKNSDNTAEIDYLKFIDPQWLDENGYGVPGLKMSISRGGEEKIVINDNDWNSYYSRIFQDGTTNKQYYIRIIDITDNLGIIKVGDVIKIQSIYDKKNSNTYDYSDAKSINALDDLNLDTWWTDITGDSDVDGYSEPKYNSQIHKIFFRQQNIYDIPASESANGYNYLGDISSGTNKKFLKIIYTLSSDITNSQSENIDYDNPSTDYVNYNSDSESRGSELQRNDKNTGKSFGVYHFNPISATSENSSSLMLYDYIEIDINNLVNDNEYIISIKDHFSRIDPGEGKNFFTSRQGYGFKITLMNDTRQISSKGELSGEDAIGFPSIPYTHSDTNTDLKLKVENNRKYPYFIVNIAEVKEDTKNYILKFSRGINFALENDTTDSTNEKMTLYINEDVEDLKRIKLVENTGISTSTNNLDQQSLTFQMNFEESNTIDISSGFTYAPVRKENNNKSFIETLNKYIDFTNKQITNTDNRKFPTMKILKYEDSNYTYEDYFKDTEVTGVSKKENPFKEKIYYPFIIPKEYRSTTTRGNFNSKIISSSAMIYHSKLYLDYGDVNSIENETNFYNNIKFPSEFGLSKKLLNCLVFEIDITPVSSANITNILTTLKTEEDSNLIFVLQLEAEIPITISSSSSLEGGSSGRNIDFEKLFDYEEEFDIDYNDDLFTEEDDIFDEDFFNFINENVNRSQKIKEEEINWISRSTETSNKNAYQGEGDFSKHIFALSEDKKINLNIIPRKNLKGVIYIGYDKKEEITTDGESVSFEIELNNQDKDLNFTHFILSP